MSHEEIALPMDAELVSEIEAQADKYESLVWYARKNDELLAIPEVAAAAKLVTDSFPQEVEDLSDPDTGDWQHGFNSGALAAFRFVLFAHWGGLDEALETFPMLDT